MKWEPIWATDGQQTIKQKTVKKENLEIKPPEKHQLYLAKEKRRGKIVTIIKPFYLANEELQSLMKTLKKKLGTGGTVKENTLELQGDISQEVQTMLEAMRYRFRG